MYSLSFLALSFLALWSLFVMIVTGLLYPAWRTARTGMYVFRNSTPSDFQPGILPQFAPKHVLQWISIGEFMTVLATCSDLIVIELRENAHRSQFPGPSDVLVIPVAPHELPDVLECLPTDRVVVFYGVSDLSILMIETSSRFKGSAPLYVLDGDLNRLEAA